MKKLILFLSLALSVGFASAQSEIPSDSIRRAPSANVKEFGGFLLDMGLMNVTAPQLPKFDLSMPDLSKDYNQIFRFNTDATYTQGFTDAFSSSSFVIPVFIFPFASYICFTVPSALYIAPAGTSPFSAFVPAYLFLSFILSDITTPVSIVPPT